MKALRKLSLSLVVALASLGTVFAASSSEDCCCKAQKKECACSSSCGKKVEKSTIDEAYIEIDGKEVSQEEMNKLDPNKIESVQVLKDKDALSKLGDKLKGRTSAIIIKTKK